MARGRRIIVGAVAVMLLARLCGRERVPAPKADEDPPASHGRGVSKQLRVPRPVHRSVPPAASAPATATGAPPSSAPVDRRPDPPPSAAPVDRRPDPPPDAERGLPTAEMPAVREVAAPCVRKWVDAEPAMGGKVRLRLSLDEAGLQDVWIEGHDEAPPGVLDCFADAVWGHEWAGVSLEPTEVTWSLALMVPEE